MSSRTILSILVLSLAAISAASTVGPTISLSVVKEHLEEAGGEGIDIVSIKTPQIFVNRCANLSNVKIEYIQRRYGKVTVEPTSIKKCRVGQCKLRLNWRHAPAGRLSYRVKARWKLSKCDT